MAEWVIQRLTSAPDRTAFSCGKAPLDTFLVTLVSQYEKRRLGRTFVATEPGQSRVAGYWAGSAQVAADGQDYEGVRVVNPFAGLQP